MAGKAIAAGLVESAATISPYDDVRGHLQQNILPVLGPAIEELLHHVHATGELQRVLREKAESERRALRRNSDPDAEAISQAGRVQGRRTSSAGTASSQQASAAAVAAAAAAAESSQDPPPGSSNSRMRSRRPSIGEGSATGPVATVGAADKTPPWEMRPSFDPVLWLSENIRKAAQGDTSQHREKITQRVIQQIKAAEAAEEAERLKAEAEAAAALLAEQGETALPEGAETAS
eukprot:TRINITY_DN12521_c0_g1_i1.p1 TRINITY_DN12521_c0_g1~~TRINITY_DN12521_c0_g1_i1.p1  ORF type:complete len:247 (-),score=59.59 TRINITY_DN12521_c0_g1_i1:531-1232(-)